MTTLPPMGDPIVMAALAHLEAGHDVRAWWCLDLLIRQMRAGVALGVVLLLGMLLDPCEVGAVG